MASVLTFSPIDPLPTGVPTGSVAMSGSNANLKMFVYGFGAAGAGSNVSMESSYPISLILIVFRRTKARFYSRLFYT
jgi:hypothetical protein